MQDDNMYLMLNTGKGRERGKRRKEKGRRREEEGDKRRGEKGGDERVNMRG